MIILQISKWHGQKRPLVLLLDGLDLLQTKDRAHTMFWLPTLCPKNVHIIVSTDSTRHGILRRLRSGHCNSDQQFFLDSTELDTKTLEMFLQREQERAKCTLQPQQMEVLKNVCMQNPNALYVTSMIKEAMKWTSYTTVTDDLLPTSIEEFVWYDLQRIEAKHGSSLVQHALCYLAVSPRGLSEIEMRDVLSCDNVVMREILNKSEPLSKETIRLPFTFISALLLDIQNFVTRCHIDAKCVYFWKHTVLKEIVSKKYFGVKDPLSRECRNEAAVFLQTLAKVFLQEKGIKETFRHPKTKEMHENADRRVIPQPLRPSNKRKLLLATTNLVNAMVNDNDTEKLKKNCLGSFHWLLTSLQGLSAENILYDAFMVNNRDADICLIQDFMSLTVNGLRRDPLSLAPQLLGTISNISQQRHSMFVGLLREAMHWLETNTAPILTPALACFPSAMDICKRRTWGLTDIIQVDRSGQLGVMKNKDGFVEIWDLNKNELVFRLGVQYDKVTPNVFTNDVEVLTMDGYVLSVWEIESGRSVRSLDVSKHIGSNSTAFHVMAYTSDFKLVSMLSSDEEFNQVIRIIDTESDTVIHKLPPFDVKDEFFGARASVFLRTKPYMVFVSVRTETMADDTQADIVKLNCFDISTGKYVYRTNCGKKTFSSLLVKDEQNAYINWQIGGFDIYDVITGVFDKKILAPEHDHLVCEAKLVSNDHIAFLTTTNEDKCEKLQSVLWLWKLDENEIKKLVHQDYPSEDEGIRKFLLPDDFTFAVLAAPDISRLYIWNLVTKMCVQSIEAHTDNTDSLFQTGDPYRFCSSSSGEVVVKWWDIYDLVPHGPEDTNELQKEQNSVATHAVSRSRKLRRSISEPSILRKRISRLKLDSQTSFKSVRFADEIAEDDVSRAETDISAIKSDVTTKNKSQECMDPAANPKYDRPNMDVELHYSLNVTSIHYSKDGKYIVSGSEEIQPVIWEACSAKIFRKMPAHSDEDVGTPIVQFACNDEMIVGLSTNDFTKNSYPYIYMFQVSAKFFSKL